MLKKLSRNLYLSSPLTRSPFSSSKNTPIDYFTPTSLGPVALPNRIVASSVNGGKADPSNSFATDLHAQYYSQRASFGLIISEFIAISQLGKHQLGGTGIWKQSQQDEWKKVVRKVHERGGTIFGQVGHAGRLSNQMICGSQPVAPSAIQAPKEGGIVYDEPKEMNLRDLKTLLNEFYQAAKKIDYAEFDGIEIYAADGFLLDQFLKESSNQRKDEYGGSIKSRCRLCIEIVDMMQDIFGAERVGIKISPFSTTRGMSESKPLELYSNLLKELANIGVGYVHVVLNDENNKNFDKNQSKEFIKAIRKHYKGTLIANGGISPKEGLEMIKAKEVDLISFGKLSLGNPDLPERIKNEWPINKDIDLEILKQSGPLGYVDYSIYKK